MKLTIEEADNGYIVTYSDGIKTVFSGEDELEVLKEMLQFVGEYYHRYDKFGSENLSVSSDRKGHKV